jgi:tetratricopeptide (TPR) repeat protein
MHHSLRTLFSVFVLIVTPILLSAVSTPALADLLARPNPGPRSKTEPSVLLNEANEAYANQDYLLAQTNYEQLINRYPSHENAVLAYPNLISIHLNVLAQPKTAISLIKQFLLLKPQTKAVFEMKLQLSSAYLASEKPVEAKIAADEVIRAKDSTLEQKQRALLNKAEVLSGQKKFKDASAALDSLESSEFDEVVRRLPTLRIRLKTRECAAINLTLKKKYTDDDYLGYFSRKNLCFKAVLPSTLQKIDAIALNDWCVAHLNLSNQLKKEKMDSSLREKIKLQITETETFARSLNADLVNCLLPPL